MCVAGNVQSLGWLARLSIDDRSSGGCDRSSWGLLNPVSCHKLPLPTANIIFPSRKCAYRQLDTNVNVSLTVTCLAGVGVATGGIDGERAFELDGNSSLVMLTKLETAQYSL